MAFEVKKHSKEEFYPEFERMLLKHSFPIISKEVLPELAFAVYDKDGIILYAIWYYFTSSKGLSWIAFPVSNKSISPKNKKGAFDFLLEYVSNYSKKKGILALFTTSSTESVISPLLNNGFEIGDIGVNHYIKSLR
jgi:hypothetical protein